MHAHGTVRGEGRVKGKVKLDDDLEMPASITCSCKTMYNMRIHFAYILGFDFLDER